MNKLIYSDEHRVLIIKLKKARLESKLKQEEVAKLLNKTQSYVSKLESGQRRIDAHIIKKLAQIYKKNIEVLLD